jgi:hypothetical protein
MPGPFEPRADAVNVGRPGAAPPGPFPVHPFPLHSGHRVATNDVPRSVCAKRGSDGPDPQRGVVTSAGMIGKNWDPAAWGFGDWAEEPRRRAGPQPVGCRGGSAGEKKTRADLRREGFQPRSSGHPTGRPEAAHGRTAHLLWPKKEVRMLRRSRPDEWGPAQGAFRPGRGRPLRPRVPRRTSKLENHRYVVLPIFEVP